MSSASLIELRASELFDSSSVSLGGPAEVDIFLPSTDWDQARQTARTLLVRSGLSCRVLLVLDDARAGFISISNRLMRASHAPFVVYAAQDAFPGRRWLALGHHVLQTQQRGLLAFNDGKWFGQLAAFGLVRRQWVQDVYAGDLFYPGYRSHYADTELTLIARAQQQHAFSANALLMEIDHDKDSKPTDADDKRLFAGRKASGFDHRIQDPGLLAQFS